MQAQDVMSTVVTTIHDGATVQEAAKLMLSRGISALPVMDAKDRLVGVVSEGDLVRRGELGTAAPRSWWLGLVAQNAAQDYLKTRSTSVRDVMTSPAITIRRGTPLAEVARLMEKHRVKRLPVLEAGRLVGVVSRADLVRRIAVAPPAPAAKPAGDRALRKQVLKEVARSGVDGRYVNVTVADATVHIWGALRTATEQKALRAAARQVGGVRRVEDHTFLMSARLQGALGSE